MSSKTSLAAVGLLAIIAGNGCRRADTPPSPIVDASVGDIDAHPLCLVPSPVPSERAWQIDIAWDRLLDDQVDDNFIMGVFATGSEILTFGLNAGFRTTLTGEEPERLNYDEGIQFFGVVRGESSAAALVPAASAKGAGHRLCLLGFDGTLELERCIALPYSLPFPTFPVWNGEAFQVVSVEPDSIAMLSMTGQGVDIPRRVLLEEKPVSGFGYLLHPIGADLQLTISGTPQGADCTQVLGQRVTGTSVDSLVPLSLPFHRSERVGAASSGDEVLVLHGGACVPDNADGLCRGLATTAAQFASRLTADGTVQTSTLEHAIYPPMQVVWDGESFVAFSSSSGKLSAYVFGGDQEVAIEAFEEIATPPLSNEIRVAALAPKEFLVAYHTLLGETRLTKVIVRPGG